MMALGAIGPWAHAQTWSSGAVSVSGFGHGAGVVLACSALVAVTLLAGLPLGAALLGVVSASWTALVMYELPGTLTSGWAWEAEIAWGAQVALVGALIVLVTAVPAMRAATPARRRAASS
jgi:hypothetical protein